MTIDISLILRALPYLAKGAWITMKLTFISYIFGLLLGTLLGYLHTLNNAFIRIPISIYVTLIRGTPTLIQITFFYYVLPLLGIELSPFWVAAGVIGVHSSAYISQVIKAGIIAVGKEQIEAAQVLGLSPWQIGKYIIIPQAIRVAFPALVGEYMTLLKDSSLASVIGVMELYKEALAIINQSYDAITIFGIVTLFYITLTFISEVLFKYLERKLRWYVTGSQSI